MKLLNSDVTYVARIVESTSGSDSSSFQVRRLDEDTSTDFTEAFICSPCISIHMYDQIWTSDGVNFSWLHALRLHYYLLQIILPEPSSRNKRTSLLSRR